MGNFKMRLLSYIIILTLTACGQSKIKVVAEEYATGKPKIIRYFNSRKDSKDSIIVKTMDGKGTVNKPLTFLEECYYENGKLQYRGQYIKGQTSGLWEYFYESGLNEAKSYYDNGKSTDSIYCWFPSGKLKRHIIEIDTTKNYWHNIDYYENGKKNIECFQTKDSSDNFQLNGLFQEWYDNGQLKFTATFKNGWTVGLWKEYEPDGKLKEESDKSFSISIK
jgi:antitoxin component YwqK of YwqJK toxin-antitoxin module